MKMETERLILRKPEVRDTEDYLEFCNSEFVLRYNAMNPKTREEVAAQFSETPNQWHPFVLERKENRKVIGIIFTEEDSLRWGVNSRELSYFIREEDSRKGYMKEALSAVIHWLFEEVKLECVAARAFEPNIASRRLLESLGFHRDGLIPRCVRGYGEKIFDDTLYSLFPETAGKEL